ALCDLRAERLSGAPGCGFRSRRAQRGVSPGEPRALDLGGHHGRDAPAVSVSGGSTDPASDPQRAADVLAGRQAAAHRLYAAQAARACTARAVVSGATSAERMAIAGD